MSNLGSDTTPIKGQNFELPAGAQLDEESGDLVIRDSGGSIVFRRDETNGEWVLDTVSADSVNTDDAAIDQLSGKETEATGFILSNSGLKELFYKTTTSENMAAHDAIQFETGISDGETRVVADLDTLPSIPKTGNSGEIKVIGIDDGVGFNSGIFFDSVSFIRDSDTRSDIEADGGSAPTRSYSQPSLSEIALTPSGASGDVRVVAIVEVVGL